MNTETPAPTARLTLHDLMAMKGPALHEVMRRGHAVDADAVAGRQFLGVDLSLPGWARKLLWHTFRKTFVRDAASGELRGWNVRMEQHGVEGARVPLKNRRGEPITFGHYRLRSADGVTFPQGYRGAQFLHYGEAGNPFMDLARLGRTPLVAVNPGRSDLLLGWEVFALGPGYLPLPLYWALRDDGPLDTVIPPPGPVARKLSP